MQPKLDVHSHFAGLPPPQSWCWTWEEASCSPTGLEESVLVDLGPPADSPRARITGEIHHTELIEFLTPDQSKEKGSYFHGQHSNGYQQT